MEIDFYRRRDGAIPVIEALETLEEERPDEYLAILSKMRVARDLSFEECVAVEHIKSVRGKIWSLKMRGHQSRILGWRYSEGFRAAHHTIKKDDQFDERDIRLAERRREDWIERHGQP